MARPRPPQASSPRSAPAFVCQRPPVAAIGAGSPHTGPGTIWPMALPLQALTSTGDAEIERRLIMLKSTHAGTGFMHESFDADDASRFTRPWFAWANTLFGELIVTLAHERPHLLTPARRA